MKTIKYLGATKDDYTLIPVDGEDVRVVSGQLVELPDQQADYLLDQYAHRFEIAENVPKKVAPKAPKTMAKLSTYSKAKK